jgi:competence protein ComEC
MVTQKEKWVWVVAGMIVGLVWWRVVRGFDTNLHIYVCDVGQGDAILAVAGRIQVLIDGGPDKRVLECLAEHVPVWDKQIELVVMTHSQADHVTGLTYVVDSYRVMQYVTVKNISSTTIAVDLERKLTANHAGINYLTAGDSVNIGKLRFMVVGPDEQSLRLSDINETGITGMLTWDGFDMYLTADVERLVALPEGRVAVLKMPHHGSENPNLEAWLKEHEVGLAVISVGKGNRFGHPSKITLEVLHKFGINVRRTDEVGTIEIVSDGQRWWVVE